MIVFVEAIWLSYDYEPGGQCLTMRRKGRQGRQSGTQPRKPPKERKSWSFRFQLAKCEPFFDGNSRAASPVHLALGRTFAQPPDIQDVSRFANFVARRPLWKTVLRLNIRMDFAKRLLRGALSPETLRYGFANFCRDVGIYFLNSGRSAP